MDLLGRRAQREAVTLGGRCTDSSEEIGERTLDKTGWKATVVLVPNR